MHPGIRRCICASTQAAQVSLATSALNQPDEHDMIRHAGCLRLGNSAASMQDPLSAYCIHDATRILR